MAEKKINVRGMTRYQIVQTLTETYLTTHQGWHSPKEIIRALNEITVDGLKGDSFRVDGMLFNTTLKDSSHLFQVQKDGPVVTSVRLKS